jgi:hypothetical protein
MTLLVLCCTAVIPAPSTLNFPLKDNFILIIFGPKIKQGRQCSVYVTLRCFHITIVAVEKQ